MGKAAAEIVPIVAAVAGSVLSGGVLAPALGAGLLGTAGLGALGGAAGDVLGDVATGQKPTLAGTLLSGAGGAVGGSSLGGALGLGGSSAAGAADTAAATGTLGSTAGTAGSTAAAAAPAAGAAGGSLSDFASPAILSASSPADLATALNATAAPTAAAAAAPAATGALSEAAPASILNASSPSQLAAALQATPAPGLASTTPAAIPSSASLLSAPQSSGNGIGITAAAPTTSGGSGGSLLSQILGNGTSGGSASLTSGAVTPAGGGDTSLLGQASNFMNAHPILTTGAGLIGSQLLSPELASISGVNNTTPAENQLISNAQPAISAANSLITSEQTGVLPPGAQQSVNNALNADIAQIQARYAALGMSGSSAEQQDIANAQNQAAANQFQLSQQATQTGLTALGLTDNVYSTLVQDQLNRQQQLQNSLTQFASSVGEATALGTALKAA